MSRATCWAFERGCPAQPRSLKPRFQFTVKTIVACALRLLLSLAVMTKVYVPTTGRCQINITP